MPSKKPHHPVPRTEAPEKVTDHRPWGGFHRYAHNEHCSVKVIWIEPGKRLSLQSHTKRSEYWVVVEGRLEVEIDGKKHLVSEGEEIFIPCGAKHRGIGLDTHVRLIEIAFGFFDEDDIFRYEDDFGRI